MIKRWMLSMVPGDTLRLSLFLLQSDSERSPVDLTGCSATMDVREHSRSSEVVDLLTVENGRLSIAPADGRIDAVFDADITADYPVRKGVGVMRVQWSDGSIKSVAHFDIAPLRGRGRRS